MFTLMLWERKVPKYLARGFLYAILLPDVLSHLQMRKHLGTKQHSAVDPIACFYLIPDPEICSNLDPDPGLNFDPNPILFPLVITTNSPPFLSGTGTS